VPGGRRGRVVEICRPTPELAHSSAFGALPVGFEQSIQTVFQQMGRKTVTAMPISIAVTMPSSGLCRVNSPVP
jgi:hypothetical protein